MNPLLKIFGGAAREAARGSVRLAQGVGYSTLYVGKYLPYLAGGAGRTIGNLFAEGSIARTTIQAGRRAAEFLGRHAIRPTERGWNNLFTGVTLSPLAKSVIAGGIAAGALMNTYDAVSNSQLGEVSNTVEPLPSTTYEGIDDKTLGATGDLVFALNALRRG
ncbi:hypothetical protein MTAT_20330 [Moorella thermoacetica]|uniref:Uncharacterized protein n=2 Tax=Neomoorella thermoacetica TaxID=1525 RepID=A0AAC9MUE4_NEOTH|nr:hypothetical protein [Moorella thermoacetica]AOQ24688.1 hypothetical protein Maut_02260 [Moorella thermoacetica]TYL12791.1 hypothetical protein MTAT_20330 [Moorella thermoacetica]